LDQPPNVLCDRHLGKCSAVAINNINFPLTRTARRLIFVDMNGTKRPRRYESVIEYVTENGLRKGWLAAQWGISPFQMSALLYPGRYRFSLSDEQWSRVASSLNQTPEYVRRQYQRAA